MKTLTSVCWLHFKNVSSGITLEDSREIVAYNIYYDIVDSDKRKTYPMFENRIA
jgi:hypothetical protein